MDRNCIRRFNELPAYDTYYKGRKVNKKYIIEKIDEWNTMFYNDKNGKPVPFNMPIYYCKSWKTDRLIRCLWNEGHDEWLKKYVKPKFNKVIKQINKLPMNYLK